MAQGAAQWLGWAKIGDEKERMEARSGKDYLGYFNYFF